MGEGRAGQEVREGDNPGEALTAGNRRGARGEGWGMGQPGTRVQEAQDAMSTGCSITR